MADITVANLGKSFGSEQVLNGFSCVVSEGKTSYIMGKSGCGKTTLLNILLGLVKKDTGNITGLKGKKVSAIFQENRLCEHLNAVQNIKLVTGDIYTDLQITTKLNSVCLHGDSLTKPVSELSGGMRRRVSIIRAILVNADVFFMDEPFKGIDEDTKKTVFEIIRKDLQGKTVVMITHDITDTQFAQGEIIVM